MSPACLGTPSSGVLARDICGHVNAALRLLFPEHCIKLLVSQTTSTSVVVLPIVSKRGSFAEIMVMVYTSGKVVTVSLVKS